MTYVIGPNGRGELDSPLWSWIPSTGDYRIVVDPDPNSAGAATGSITVTLSHDVEPAIQVGGPAVTFPMSRLGQNGPGIHSVASGAVAPSHVFQCCDAI
jgi:hypothetical protein